MTTTHSTKFAGLELEVTGYYDSGETGDYFLPDSPAYFEVEQITPVAGVRGSEAKYEILKYLYYRKSMKKNKKKRK